MGVIIKLPKDRGEYELNNERILKGLEQAILSYDIEGAKKVAKEVEFLVHFF